MFANIIADELGLLISEIEGLDYEVYANASDDGLVYGYNINIVGASTESLFLKVKNAVPDGWLYIGPTVER